MIEYVKYEGLRLRRKVRALVLKERGEVLLVRPHGYREGEQTLAGPALKAENPLSEPCGANSPKSLTYGWKPT